MEEWDSTDMMISILLSQINVIKTRHLPLSLRVENCIRGLQIYDRPVPIHRRRVRSGRNTDAIMSKFMDRTGSVFESSHGAFPQFLLGRVGECVVGGELESEGVLSCIPECLPEEKSDDEAMRVSHTDDLATTRALEVSHRRGAGERSCILEISSAATIPVRADEMTLRVWRLLGEVDVGL